MLIYSVNVHPCTDLEFSHNRVIPEHGILIFYKGPINTYNIHPLVLSLMILHIILHLWNAYRKFSIFQNALVRIPTHCIEIKSEHKGIISEQCMTGSQSIRIMIICWEFVIHCSMVYIRYFDFIRRDPGMYRIRISCSIGLLGLRRRPNMPLWPY